MTFPSNNSKNVANLLRYDALDPIQPRRNVPQLNDTPTLPRVKQQQQIPLDQVFTPQQNSSKRIARRRTPLSSSGNNNNEQLFRISNRQQDLQLQSFKVRLDQIIKYYDQRHNNLESKMMIRLNQLQNFVMKEVPKIDNTATMTSDVIAFKQIIKDVRRQQEHQLQQIHTLKVLMNQKNNNESSVSLQNKDKQKMTVLFMEVVRLGDSVQKMSQEVNSVTRSYQSKIQQLQHKLLNSQKNLSIISQRNTTGTQVMNQLGDKVMNRLQTAQSNLLILGKEQIKDKQALSKLASQNERIGQDLQMLLRNMQGDFQNKLDNRISETINRLMFEHQQRIKAQQQIRKNLDLREKINQQKQNSQKQQNRQRLQSMDVLVRNEFVRKQQSIHALASAMQEQFRTFKKQIFEQGNKRKQQEISFRGEIKRIQQNFRKEYDVYKNHQSDLVEKITDMIKAEITVRLSSELDLKKLTSDIANQLVTDINNVKQAISNSNKKLNLSLREVANESSQRSGQLSHYVDSQIRKVVDIVTQKYSKMKNVFTKIAQQFKSHLQNTQTNRKNVEVRLTTLEDDFNKLRNQVNAEIEDFYNDLQSRLKQQKEYVQTFVFKKNNDLTIRVNKLQQYTNQYFQVLKTGMQDNKSLLNNKLANVNEARNPESEQQLRQLRTIVFNIRQLAQAIKTQNEESIRQLKKQLQSYDKQSRQEVLEMKSGLLDKIDKTNQRNIELQENLNDLTVKVNGLRADSGSNNVMDKDRIKKLSDEIDNLVNKIKDVEQQSMQQCNKNGQDIIRLRSDYNVLKGQIGALDDDIKKLQNV